MVLIKLHTCLKGLKILQRETKILHCISINNQNCTDQNNASQIIILVKIKKPLHRELFILFVSK